MCDLCDPLPLSPVHTNVWLSLSRGKNNMAGNMRLNHSCDFEFDINESAWFFSFFKYNFQTCLHLHLKKKRNNNKKVVFLEKFEYFHRPGPGVAILAVCRRFGNRRLHHACLRFVSQQEHLFPHCFGNFYFVLSENNLKIISTWLPEKWQMLIHCSWDTMVNACFELPQNSVPRVHKTQYRNGHYGGKRSQDLHVYVPPKYSGLENKQTATQV